MLLLSTYGSDPGVAFKIARRFQNRYGEFIIFPPSVCKSAGTLVALGAHRILMNENSEFGPIDVQFPDEDEFEIHKSGLG